MGYAGYAPGHKTDMRTPLQEYLKMVKVDKSLETMEKLTRNSAQSPGDEKFRKVRPRPCRPAVHPRVLGRLNQLAAHFDVHSNLRRVASRGIMPTDEEVTCHFLVRGTCRALGTCPLGRARGAQTHAA